MLLRIYRFLSFILAPLIDLYILLRLKKGKEDSLRYKERLGHSMKARPKGKIIWVHCASVGESICVLPLINLLSKNHPEISILVTTVTVSSANLLKTRLPDNCFHQFVPVDKIYAVRRFLKHWHPDLALWVESELWPNLIVETANFCPLLLVNARMSDRSFSRWQRFPKLASELLNKFTQIYAQDIIDQQRYSLLSDKDILCLGNMKFDAPKLHADPEKILGLQKQTQTRKTWLCASTHDGEELMIAQTHLYLKKAFPELLTIIAPRHPKRTPDILKQCSNLDIKIAVRSQNDKIDDNTDIYLADTLGEMGLFYRIAPIVFIGGSLVPHGGQNPLEPARLDSTILFGPFMNNFVGIRNEFLQKKAAIEINKPEDLQEILTAIFPDKKVQDSYCVNAAKLVAEKSGIIDAYYAAVTGHISS